MSIENVPFIKYVILNFSNRTIILAATVLFNFIGTRKDVARYTKYFLVDTDSDPQFRSDPFYLPLLPKTAH